MPRSEAPAAALIVLGGWLLLMPAASLLARDAACPAIGQLQPMLNSERIESCFGSYGVEVLEQGGRLRIASLYSLEGEQRITRTLAVSEFADSLPDRLQPVYQAIRAGASMGAALESAGWQVEKRQRYLGEVPASAALRCMSGFPATHASDALAIQLYDLWVKRGDDRVLFARLAELHDPRYLTLADLRQLYPGFDATLQDTGTTPAGLLQVAAEACTAH